MVHPSKRGIEIFNPQEQMAYLNSIEQINTRNDNIELVALLYSGFLTCGFISLMDYVFLNAPKKFVKDFDVKKKLKKQIEKFYNFYNYFWFIFNDPHEYDKFQYCVSSIGTKKKSPKMSEIKNGDVPFNKDILARIDNLQKGWHNNTCGGYNPPF